jgi:predicted ATPase
MWSNAKKQFTNENNLIYFKRAVVKIVAHSILISTAKIQSASNDGRRDVEKD